jgi:hypothetical protein
MTDPQAWEKLRQTLAQSMTDFWQVTEQLAEADWERPGVCGYWSPKAVVAHMIGWDLQTAIRFRQFLAGQTDDFEYDIDAFNNGSVVARAHLSWSETLAALTEAQQIFWNAVDAVKPDDFAREARFAKWLVNTRKDYLEHADEFRAWLV